MILALEMFRSVPRHIAARAVGGHIPGILSGPVAPLRLVTIDEPRVARPEWARLRTRVSGICGSDLGALSGRTSLYFSGLVSMPLVPGHEVVADLVGDCDGLSAGTRVVIDPILACAARGIEPCGSCASGVTNRCDRITVGHLRPGLQTGYCGDTGGGWGEQLAAHRSQLHAVPDSLTDEQAVLVEPIACAVHTALRARVAPGDHVLVSGAGSVGLLTTLALRQLTDAGQITVVAKHGKQRELAREMGASDVVAPGGVLRGVRRSTRAFHVEPERGPSYLLGGVDIAVDAVGSRSSLETALHATRAGGRVVLSGMPAAADLSAAWFRELEVVGSYASAQREPALDGRPAFEVAIELAGRPEAATLAAGVVSYPLHRWREALDHAHSAGRLGTVKVAFDPEEQQVSRPGFVLEVDDRTPPIVVHEGEGFRLERFPLGTRVVYGPESLPAIADVQGAIRHALLNPEGSEPLPALLRPGMRLTIAFDDVSIPLPPMQAPDIRQRIIEAVLTMAADAGVDDVALISANALHRRLTEAELRHIVGERVFRSFYPLGLLTNHDAEDPENMLQIGVTEQGEDVEINRRAAESDLLVYVNVNLVAMDGGHKSVPIGLAGYKSLRHHHNSKTMVRSHSFMDHTKSQLHHSAWRMGRLLAEHLRIFQIETTLNSDSFPKPYDFLLKREWEWGLRDQASMLAVRRGLALAPPRLRHKMFHDLRAPYGLTGVHAGETEAVHDKTIANVHRQQLVEVQGQSDIMVMGIPFIGPYNIDATMNPILATCMGLGYYFNSYRGQPVVRKGGVVILYHPVKPEFNQLQHPSYVDFYEEVLAESTDPAVIEAKFEQQYATDPWYIHLYRTSHAYHGVHPFYMWYWAAHAMDHVGDVIWVGGDRRAVARMGFRAASSLADALEIASDTVGGSPSITVMRNPPLLLADVR